MGDRSIARSRWIAFGVCLVLVGIMARAAATIPSGDGIISSCYVKTTGGLRVIDPEVSPSQACRNGEVPLSWNQEGRDGEPGADGAVGPSGPAGPPGPGGAPDVYYTDDVMNAGAVGFGWETVTSKDVPAGNYLVEGRVSVASRTNSMPVTCELRTAETMGETKGATNGGWAGQIDLTLALKEHPGGPISVRCITWLTEDGPRTDPRNISISAVSLLITKAGSVN